MTKKISVDSGANVIKSKIHLDEGEKKIHIEDSQDVSEIISNNKRDAIDEAYKLKGFQDAKMYKVASIPLIVVQELAQKGITFHPKSKFYTVCSDVVLVAKPGQVLPHYHQIKVSKPDVKHVEPDSGPAEPVASPTQNPREQAFPLPVKPFSPPSSP